MKKLPFLIIAILIFGCVFANIKRSESASLAQVSESLGAAADDDYEYEVPARSLAQTDEDDDYESCVDTMFVVNGKVLNFDYYDEYDKYGLFYDMKPTVYDPTTGFDSLSSTTFAIDLVGRRKVFDATRSSCIDEVKAFISPMRGFRRFERDYEQYIDTFPQITRYVFTLDYPDTTVARRHDIMEWIVGLVERSQTMEVSVPWYTSVYAGYKPSSHDDAKYQSGDLDVAKLGRFASDKFFKSVRDEYGDDLPMGVYLTIDYRARILNDRFVTYRSYVHYREGWGHGMMTSYLHSYDLKNSKPIDYDYLFKPGTYSQVKRMLYEVIAADTAYTKGKNLEPTAEGVEKWIEWWNEDVRYENTGEELGLPQPGLTESGIVFSFQPYEIDCFAAGFWHFTLPFAQVKPYMTKQAIDMLGI